MSIRKQRNRKILACLAVLWLALGAAAAQDFPQDDPQYVSKDPYTRYITTSRDFEPVGQDPAWALAAWPGWIYMPWTYQWPIGYSEASGQWSLQHGYNGAFLDHGRTEVGGADKLAWIDKHGLRFYVDHVAGKGDLHLFDGGDAAPYMERIHSPKVRMVPVNDALRARLEKKMKERIGGVLASPRRAAYALDDEPSWGHFVHPCMWRITDDEEAYDRWLAQVYDEEDKPEKRSFTTYDAIWPRLEQWAIKDFDCSALMDQWTFNDAVWCNFIGELVTFANRIDPATPCGIVGGQSPSPFGGYDYARLMRKLQFIEAYNLGGSQAIIRSFNPHNALPTVTTHFHAFDPANPAWAEDSIWQTWYYLAHGNCGFIGWVENWFDEKGKALPWHDRTAPHYLEAGKKIGPLVRGAQWIHDGVALYYSHPSIQLGWILDAQAHKRTWRNRNRDHELGASHLVRLAWENMLRDEGLQYDFLSYVDLIQKGVPEEYKVLILPACLCLSDVEVRRIVDFCLQGGTVIADYLPGLWDQHGRGREEGGALDALFCASHDPHLKGEDIFQKTLWSEVDQDRHYSYRTFEEFYTMENSCLVHESGFHKAVRPMASGAKFEVKSGKGRAALMNLSPQKYNEYREKGFEASKAREIFMKQVKAGGPRRWVEILGAGDASHGYEITYWKKGDRTLVFVCFNPQILGTSTGGGHARGLKSETLSIKLRFSGVVKDVINERTGKKLGDGQVFALDWKMNEALVLSFAGTPVR